MSDKLWKAFERRVAAYFGTTRTPLSGSNSKHNTESDTLHNTLYIEAKRDKKFLGVILTTLLHSVAERAKRESKIPVICLKEHGKQGFYIVVHSKHLGDVANEKSS